jgi:hypothetical protein
MANIAVSFGERFILLYRNSEAISFRTFRSVKDSMISFQSTAALLAVPHPSVQIFLMLLKKASWSSNQPSMDMPLALSSLHNRAVSITAGCSVISLYIKVS